jgi:FkbM family methyltransferase
MTNVSLEVAVLTGTKQWIQDCFIDVRPERVAPGQPFDFGGVVVVGPDAPSELRLQIRAGERLLPVRWGIASPRMARSYPESGNGEHARFRSDGLSLAAGEREFSLEICSGNQECSALVRCVLGEEENFSRVYREPADREIFDVGANDGADTWYYLRKGFRVVAVEAIPALAADLRATYADQLEAGRLTIAAVAIAENAGKVALTINEERSEWSSTKPRSKASLGRSRVIEVESDTLANLIRRHPSPYYIKIDIEGGELAAVNSLGDLPRGLLPQFISFEINLDWEEILEKLYAVGYRKFQLVRQGAAFLNKPPSPSREGLDFDCVFTSNMSGPFGLDLPSEHWVGLIQLVRQIIESRERAAEVEQAHERRAWFDVHAMLEPSR